MTKLHKYLPQRTLSKIVGWLATREWGLLTQWAIRLFIRHYGIDMQEAQYPDIRHYPSFNAFFTRHLKKELRPVVEESRAIASPVDGIISEIGQIRGENLIQAKNHHYTIPALLGEDPYRASQFLDGDFFTAYLAPKNYHRIHMPLDGRLIEMIHIPGKLFSVNPASVQTVPRLFVGNERGVCLFETENGLMAVILVGAMLVGSINTVWHGTIVPTAEGIAVHNYREKNIKFKRGEEIGHFKMGSTVILLFPKNTIQWNPNCQPKGTICYGENIGTVSLIEVA
ncbi:archaetidylserine decarboxylase [Coxiella endosymbiont of Ornithodoros maritimus]|uniref:archaetidylserine decarboxylase n=1 Tax=Coxiella endosymbiont of Ornithodoros maritimus TaxID=1656172 RepID=UPI0022650048|nr:archaetidylserine decarboxylase [Coxiella endosymbiont of Ornithodoros maritimus]